MLREDTWNVRVSIDGRDLGTWDKKEGGETDSEDLVYRPGGLADQITLGGARTIGNVTVSKLHTIDVNNVFHWLYDRTGRGSMVVTCQPLDADGLVYGRGYSLTGKLKGVKPPDIDSEGNDAGLIELEMTCEGRIS